LELVEHACHKCGAAVEDGVAFCPHCAAPQIRVMAAAQPAPAPVRYSFDAPAGAPERPISLAELQPGKLPRSWAAANLAAGLAALLALIVAVATGLPQLAFLVWMLGGGMLAVAIYRRRQRLASMTAGLGARLGARAGLMGFVIFGLLSLAQMLALRGTGQLRAALEQAMKTSAARSGNPEAQQMLQHFLTPEGIRTLIILGIVFMLVLFVAVSTLGGAIAGALAGKRETRSL
jgi:hypothetical protein